MFNHVSDNSMPCVASTPTGKGTPMPNICVTPITDQMGNRSVTIASKRKEILLHFALCMCILYICLLLYEYKGLCVQKLLSIIALVLYRTVRVASTSVLNQSRVESVSLSVNPEFGLYTDDPRFGSYTSSSEGKSKSR